MSYLEQLQDEVEGVEIDNMFPDVVPGRVVQQDADSLNYLCAGNDTTTLNSAKRHLRETIVERIKFAGADNAHLHLTGGDGSKGGRYEIAVTKPYQANRIGLVKPKNLYELRAYTLTLDGTTIDGCHIKVTETSEEADDSITTAQQLIIDAGTPELSVAHFEDKDMLMMDGLVMDWNTFEITESYGLGHIYFRETPSGAKKLSGRGKLFFFAQLLMGDSTDNIPGLPYFTSKLAARYWPTADLTEQVRRLNERTMPSGKTLTDSQLEKAQDKVKSILKSFKSKASGQSSAYDYIHSCTSEKEAFLKCLQAYSAYYGKDEEVFNPHTQEVMIWQPFDFLLEQARLLWMRRYPYEDVKDYLLQLIK